MNLAVFLSGTGTDFQAIADAALACVIDVEIRLVISNRIDAPGLDRAHKLGIPTRVFDRSEYADGNTFGSEMLSVLNEHKVDFIALAGYLRKIPPIVVRGFKGRIINIHPALLPKYGGKGMYGMNVHRAVIENGDTITGITIHHVDEIYDNGDIIAQREVPVNKDDTAETLAARVLEEEHRFYPEVLGQLARKYLQTKENK